jgi:multiple sugar transport system substrate-binding protein
MSRLSISRRRLLAGIGITAALPVLQACGAALTPTPAPTKPPAPAGAPTPAASAGAKPAASGAGATNKTNVRWMTWVPYLKDMPPLFHAKNERVNVVFEQVPFGEIADRLLVDLAAGTAADLIQVPSTYWIPFMRRKITYPIDDLLKQDKIDAAGFDFPIEKHSQFDGKTWGLPRNIPVVRGMVYNKRLFDEAGVKYPPDYKQAGEWSWNDLTTAAQTLHKPPDRYAMTALRTGFVLAMMIRSNGGQIVSDDDKRCLLDSPEAIEAVQTAVDWTAKHKVTMQPGEEKILGEQLFASDKLATNVAVYGHWDFHKTDTKNLTIPAAMTTWPLPPNLKKRVYPGEAHANAMSGKTKVVDAAWEFWRWSTVDDEALRWQTQFVVPAYRARTYVDYIADPRQKAFTGLQIGVLPDVVLDYWGPNTTEVQKAFFAEHDLALLGKKSTADAMKDAAKTINAILQA